MKAPTLTITEILPDSSNVEGADAYEFVEICNNANKSINLKDYRLSYTYPDRECRLYGGKLQKDKILEPGETLIFWIKNGSNDGLTLSDLIVNLVSV